MAEARSKTPLLSVVAPMFNEESNIRSTYSSITSTLEANEISDYELVFANDGSTDNTWEVARAIENETDNLKVCGYPINQGRGKALRTGIDAASGKYIITVDFDLTYDANHIIRLYNELCSEESPDAVLASCYMPGGKTIGVSPFRLFVSKTANRLYRMAFGNQIYTSTCVVRGYKAGVIQNLPLESNDKEIHLEILSKLFANNFKVVEIPGTLKRRDEVGPKRKTFKFRKHSISHIIYFIHERPFVLFGALGSLMATLGLLAVGILAYTRFGGDPEFNELFISKIVSPNFITLLMISGLLLTGIGFLGIQNNHLKKELFKTQFMLKSKERQ